MKKKIKVNILIFQEKGWWVAQCIEYDIVAQARTLKDVQNEFQRIFCGRISIAEQLGLKPFEDIPPAPEAYIDIFNDKINTYKVEFKPIDYICNLIPPAFMLPQEASLYAAY
ncbi:MAG: hypothetical protein ABIN18_22285 [Pseudomonadota bacterium]